ncbi:hypothetical protein HDU86_005064 [Geranomyces michiganensis]|nr:hypothetical protein HDU86_005064 [Geranomyces michiganensis]
MVLLATSISARPLFLAQRITSLPRLSSLLHRQAVSLVKSPVKAFASDVKATVEPSKALKPLPPVLFNLEIGDCKMFPKYLDAPQTRLFTELFSSLGDRVEEVLDPLISPPTGIMQVDIRLRRGPVKLRAWIDFDQSDDSGDSDDWDCDESDDCDDWDFDSCVDEQLDRLLHEQHVGAPLKMPRPQDWATEDDSKLWMLKHLHCEDFERIANYYFAGGRTATECHDRWDALASSESTYARDLKAWAEEDYEYLAEKATRKALESQ